MKRNAIVAALVATSWPANAVAQEAADEVGSDSEIIVTAQKREQRLQDVPLSIAVQSGDALLSQGIDEFIELQALVPNLSITDTPANASIFIRGIGTAGNNLSFEQSVALFVDQVYAGRNRQFMNPFFDVERVEVMRGPQGALFGRNTSAGAISVTTRRPTQDFEADFAADYEFRRGSYNLQAGASGPLSDTLSIRVAGRYVDDKGWIDNTVLDRKEPVSEEIMGRLSLLWQPEGVTVFAKAEYGDSEIIGAPFEFVPAGTRPDYEVNTNDGLAPLLDISDNFNALLDVNIEVGDHVLTSVTSYSGYDYGQAFNIQARAPARLVTQNFEEFEQFSQEVRLASPTGDAIDYIVGGYYEWSASDIDRVSLIDTPAPPALNNDNRRDFFQETEVVALFGELNWRFADQFTLGVGGRWTRINKEGRVSGEIRAFLPNGMANVTPRPSFDAEFTDNDFSPTVNLLWQPNRNVTLYARFAEGNKGGALNEAAAFFEEYILEPEQAKSYEIGAKLQFPEIGAFLNVSGFLASYDNLQKSTLDINTATFIAENAAGARTQGIELDAGISPARGVDITLAAAYLDAYYTGYPDGPCRFDAPPTCVSQDRTGDALQNAPNWTGNIAVNVERPLTSSLDYMLNWVTTYQSNINYQDFLDPTHVQEAFSMTDVRVAIGGRSKDWELGLLVRNLFDKQVSTIIFSTFPIGVAPQDRVHMPAPLRSYTLQARLFF